MKKILLHICCAPCGSASVERLLAEEWDVTLYYFMPNIYPKEEWEKRKLYVEKLAKHFGIELIVGDYDHDFWLKNVAGLEHEKEGGLRCHACFKTLLSATAQKAEELGFEHFATTLTISPHKNSNVIQAIGEQFKGYTHYDFKKKDGYKRSIELSKELDLYRQCYCACEFSMNKKRKGGAEMRIILVGTAFPYRGGLAAFNERLALEFQSEGDEISIETFTLQYPDFLFPGKTQYSNGTAPNLKINRSVNSINPFNWQKTARAIAQKNPDVVIFAYWMSFMAPCFGTIARVLKRRCNARCIGLIHNMIAHEPSILDKILAPYFVNAMDGFFTLSQSVFKEIELFERKPKPKSWSPHPIYDTYGALISKEQACRHIGLNPDKRYILFFGFIREYKGLDLLLHAMANERIKFSNIHLLVAGEFYSNEEKYKKLAEHLGIQNITWFSEYIPDNEVNNYFCAADVIVQPYKSATQSGVTQVGYHFEKPMIVTNVGGLAEIIPDEKVGYVVEPNSHALANAIVKFFASDNAIKMTENIRDEKKKYAWNILTEKFRALLK